MSIRDLLVLYVLFGCGLLMLSLVMAVVGRQHRPGFLHIEGSLGGDLVIPPTSQTCSMGAWSLAPPHWLGQRGLGRSSHLEDLFGGDLVIRPALHNFSTRAWSLALPQRLTWRGFSRSPRLRGLLGKDILC